VKFNGEGAALGLLGRWSAVPTATTLPAVSELAGEDSRQR
jgi:hypothetical protein